MPGKNQWEKADLVEPKPPTTKVMPGRPSGKKGKKEVGEGDEKKRRKCSNCGCVGHRANKCKNPSKPKPQGPKSKGGRPKSTDPVVQHVELRKNRKKQRTMEEGQCSSQPPPQQSQASQASCISIT